MLLHSSLATTYVNSVKVFILLPDDNLINETQSCFICLYREQ